MYNSLEQLIRSKKARIALVGLGYVGLPLALAFARKGFKVEGIDTSTERVAKLERGESYITDVTHAEIAREVKRGAFRASVDAKRIRECQAVIICVPTPIKRRYTPDVSFMVSAVKSVVANLMPGTLVVLESTTYPGTTEELIKPMLEDSGLRVGQEIFLAFSPERIDPGNKNFHVQDIPKVVGGMTPACGRLTALLYGAAIKKVHVVSSPRAAEMTKLLENTFRIVNIGWVNEAAMMCRKFDIDIWEVVDAAKTKPFGFMPFYPGLGVGGHCIPEDPIYLYWKAKQKGYASKFIKLAADVNSAMPDYAVSRVGEMLDASGKKLKGAKVLVLGVTYKRDVKDLRKSPSLKLIEAFLRRGAAVDFHDPLVPFLNINGIKKDGVLLSARVVKGYDCVIVAVDHTAVDYAMVLKNARRVFDARNVFKGIASDKVVKL